MLERLNERQRDAVETIGQPLLVLAGAGSGKTRTLTSKIAWLIREKGMDPYNILAVTFTNKAAREMKERVHSLLGYDAQNMMVATFHSACVRMLREMAPTIGLSSTFSIFDDGDQRNLLGRILDDMGLADTKISIPQISNYISDVKSRLLDAQTTASDKYFTPVLGDIYLKYQMGLEDNQALDFDDLILKTLTTLTYNEELRKYYQERFQYVLVDEFQDTNPAQYQLVQLLVGNGHHIFVVGDDDQSIYSWRGADLSHVFQFEEDFKNTKIIRLEQNYRSTPQILAAANALIAHNTRRKGKSLFTDEPAGPPVQLTVYGGDREEARGIAHEVKRRVHQGWSLEDMAILYRTNSMTRHLEDALRREEIPFRIVGGVGFYQRKEIRDLMAYLKLVLNPNDQMSFLRILNVPRRGIGKAGLDKILEMAQREKISPVMFEESHFRSIGTVGKKLEPFVQMMQQITGLLGMLDPTELIDTILELTGYEEMLHAEQTEESRQRLDNLQEFRKVVREQLYDTPDMTLEQLVTNISLYTDAEREDEGRQLLMMTLHTAKGLEFPVVFLPGLEEGLMPHHRSLGDEDSIEEERRLLYVGITRAQSELYLSYAQTRFMFNVVKASLPSRFVRELPPNVLNVREERPVYQTNYSAYPEDYGEGSQIPAYSRPPSFSGSQKVVASIRPVTFENDGPNGEKLPVHPGDRVTHPILGPGDVLAIEDDRVQVAFEDGKDRWLSWDYAKLSKI